MNSATGNSAPDVVTPPIAGTQAKASGELLLLSCSPRHGGNCDTACHLFAKAFAQAHPDMPSRVLFLRDFSVSPCVVCGACERAAHKTAESIRSGARKQLDFAAFSGESSGAFALPFACPLTQQDDSAVLLSALGNAAAVCLVVPVYFYHVPAIAKALIDRTQSLWMMQEAGVSLFSGPPKPCFSIMLGAREKGELLFQGIEQSFRYSLPALHLKPQNPLRLYGLDTKDDLRKKQAVQESIQEYATAAAVALQNAQA